MITATNETTTAAMGRVDGDSVVSLAPALSGLSHSIGEPTMGVIDERFDQECIERFTRGGDPERQ